MRSLESKDIREKEVRRKIKKEETVQQIIDKDTQTDRYASSYECCMDRRTDKRKDLPDDQEYFGNLNTTGITIKRHATVIPRIRFELCSDIVYHKFDKFFHIFKLFTTDGAQARLPAFLSTFVFVGRPG